MVNIIKPIPGGDLGTWGRRTTRRRYLAGAPDGDEADAADAQTAAGTGSGHGSHCSGCSQYGAFGRHCGLNGRHSSRNGCYCGGNCSQYACFCCRSAPAVPDPGKERIFGILAWPVSLRLAPLSRSSWRLRANRVSFSLSYSPYGLRTDRTTYYDPAGVPASDRAYPAVQPDGTVRLVKLGVGSASTGDVTPPTLSGFAANSITSVSASVTCTSSEAATAVVQYGTTTSYGSQAAAIGSGTGFAVPVTGLTASTLYHYRWRVTDLAGNLTVSADQTFTTAAAGAAMRLWPTSRRLRSARNRCRCSRPTCRRPTIGLKLIASSAAPVMVSP